MPAAKLLIEFYFLRRAGPLSPCVRGHGASDVGWGAFVLVSAPTQEQAADWRSVRTQTLALPPVCSPIREEARGGVILSFSQLEFFFFLFRSIVGTK